jgi:hypothetical protein
VDPQSRDHAQVVARCVALALALVALGGTAQAQLARDSDVPIREAWPSCAGDGAPPPATTRVDADGHTHRPWSLQLSALAAAWAPAWTGDDVRITDLDAVDGSGIFLAAARLGGCGLLRTSKGTLSWDVVYEPYALDEAAQPDRRAWGRFAAAEIGFAPFRWLTLSVGVRKIAFSYGHDEPLQLLALPVRPYVSQSIAPDRRFGLTIDDDFGVAHVVLGIYEGNRDLTITSAGGLLLTARLVAEPIGPVGNTPSTAFDPPLWRGRPRFAINASILYQYAAGHSDFALGADGALHWGPVGLVGEFLYASDTTVEAPLRLTPRLRATRQGLWLEAAAMLWRPWLELAARYDWLDNPHQAGQRFHAVTVGLTFYAFRQLLRLQALYTRKLHFAIAPTRPQIQDDVLLFAATLALERVW